MGGTWKRSLLLVWRFSSILTMSLSRSSTSSTSCVLKPKFGLRRWSSDGRIPAVARGVYRLLQACLLLPAVYLFKCSALEFSTFAKHEPNQTLSWLWHLASQLELSEYFGPHSCAVSWSRSSSPPCPSTRARPSTSWWRRWQWFSEDTALWLGVDHYLVSLGILFSALLTLLFIAWIYIIPRTCFTPCQSVAVATKCWGHLPVWFLTCSCNLTW